MPPLTEVHQTSTAEPTSTAPASTTTPARATGWHEAVGRAGREVGLPVLAAMVVLTGITVAVGLLIHHHPDGPIGTLDLRVARALVERRTPLTNELTGWGTELGGTVVVTVLWVAATALAVGLTRRWTIPLFLLVAVGADKLTYLVAGLIVGRPRPPVEPIGTVFATSSFPSGHVGSAVTLYGALVVAFLWHRRASSGRAASWATRVLLGAGVAAVAVIVAISRTWRGHHYLSDVVWGAALGAVWLALAWRLVLPPAGERAALGAAG